MNRKSGITNNKLLLHVFAEIEKFEVTNGDAKKDSECFQLLGRIVIRFLSLHAVHFTRWRIVFLRVQGVRLWYSGTSKCNFRDKGWNAASTHDDVWWCWLSWHLYSWFPLQTEASFSLEPRIQYLTNTHVRQDAFNVEWMVIGHNDKKRSIGYFSFETKHWSLITVSCFYWINEFPV